MSDSRNSPDREPTEAEGLASCVNPQLLHEDAPSPDDRPLMMKSDGRECLTRGLQTSLFDSRVESVADSNVAVLTPLDVEESLELAARSDLGFKVTMLDPWYNKGVGGERDDYVEYILRLLHLSSNVSPHTFLWGFPEIVSRFIPHLPSTLKLNCWLTWYYKNNPSVIRGWRSAQMTCLHLTREDAVLYPEQALPAFVWVG